MSGYVARPILALIGVTFALVFVILALGVLEGVPIIPAATSTALVSTGTGYNQELPFIGLIIAGGMALGALGRKR